MTLKCKCGCGTKIEIKPHHKRYGIPSYILGHNGRLPKGQAKKNKLKRTREWKLRNTDKIIKHNETKKDKLYHRKDKYVDSQLRRSYNITLVEYNTMLEKQDHRCAACGLHENDTRRRLCVDHNHDTGEIRGLLCDRCNMALGLLDDDVLRLQHLVEYLNA